MSPSLEILLPLVKTTAIACFKQGGELRHSYKPDGSLVTQIDEQIQQQLGAKLAQVYPQYPLLGEEMPRAEQQARLENSAAGLWILDPIDGTTNFSAGLPIYGLSLAFVKGGSTELAIVYDPVRDECFTAKRGGGAWLNQDRLRGSSYNELSDCIANVDYKRLTNDMVTQLIACPPYRSQRNLGSSVLEWCWLAAGRVQIYLHGGQHLWDYAAAQLILTEAGGMASTMEGAPIRADSLSKQSIMAAGNARLYAKWAQWIKRQTRT